MRIVDSARKRGISDDDIWHALRNYVALYPDEGWVDMYIGAARDGTMLEIGGTWDDDPGQFTR